MIIIKSAVEIEKMRVANQIVAKVLTELKTMVKEGITTAELNRVAEEITAAEGAKPAFKGYRGFPESLCASVNEEVVHGIPGERKLKSGDLVSLDFGTEYEGYYGDSAITLPVGKISEEARRLIDVTRESLYKGIEQVKVGNHLSDISNAIQTHAESAGFSVVTDFVGHGIGTSPHEEPQIPNFGPKGEGPILEEGMVLAIEPMINEGGYEVSVKDDQWTVVTNDGKLSAHFEHSVAVTKNGPDILSKRLEQ